MLTYVNIGFFVKTDVNIKNVNIDFLEKPMLTNVLMLKVNIGFL